MRQGSIKVHRFFSHKGHKGTYEIGGMSHMRTGRPVYLDWANLYCKAIGLEGHAKFFNEPLGKIKNFGGFKKLTDMTCENVFSAFSAVDMPNHGLTGC